MIHGKTKSGRNRSSSERVPVRSMDGLRVIHDGRCTFPWKLEWLRLGNLLEPGQVVRVASFALEIEAEHAQRELMRAAVPCPRCRGDQVVPCSRCHGKAVVAGKVPCPNKCDDGLKPCPDCRGTGRSVDDGEEEWWK